MIARGAAQRGWCVHAGFPALDATARLRDDLAAAGVRCHPLALLGMPGSRVQALRSAVAEFSGTMRLLADVRPRAVLVVLPHPDQAPGLVLAAALYPARSVTSVQLVPPGLLLTDRRRLLYGFSRAAHQRWVTLSADNRRRLAGVLGWRCTAIELIYNGVADDSIDHSRERPELRRQVRDELELSSDAKLIVSVGRLNHQKGYDLIADSIPAIAVDHPEARWAWAGEGPEREYLSSRLRRLGVRDRVRMLGHRDDVPRLLAAADLFVLPSRYEGAPFALLEALMAELPVLATDAGPLPEIVRDRQEGRLVAPEDPAALGAMTSWALDHGEAMSVMAAAGRRRMLTEFSLDGMVERTLTLLAPGAAFSLPVWPRMRSGSARLRDPR